MTLNPPSFRSLKFDIKYLKNGDRLDDGINESHIGNHPCTIDWHHDLRPWLTLNRLRSRSPEFNFKYLENGESYDVGFGRKSDSKRSIGFRLAL